VICIQTCSHTDLFVYCHTLQTRVEMELVPLLHTAQAHQSVRSPIHVLRSSPVGKQYHGAGSIGSITNSCHGISSCQSAAKDGYVIIVLFHLDRVNQCTSLLTFFHFSYLPFFHRGSILDMTSSCQAASACQNINPISRRMLKEIVDHSDELALSPAGQRELAKPAPTCVDNGLTCKNNGSCCDGNCVSKTCVAPDTDAPSPAPIEPEVVGGVCMTRCCNKADSCKGFSTLPKKCGTC